MVQHGHGMARLGWRTTAQRLATLVSLATLVFRVPLAHQDSRVLLVMDLFILFHSN